MKNILVLAVVLLAACSPDKDDVRDAPAGKVEHSTTRVARASAAPKQIPGFEGYPTAQPNGAPLTEEYCEKVGDEPGSAFDNTKTCLLIACQMGDKASCKMAETYNGNLWPDGVPPDERNQTNSD